MAKAIWKFRWDCGTLGLAEGIFVADEESVKAAIGRSIYIRDALGNGRSLRGKLSSLHLAKVTTNTDTVTTFEDMRLQTGFNPLDYLVSEG